MVFSSPPLYLDPHNWHHHHQQQAQILHHHHQNQQLNTIFNHHVDTNGVGSGLEIPVLIPPPVLPSQAIDGRNTNSIKPGSMSDRARQAKIPLPDPGLKCPRCQSTNTKFCYFNNYSLTQPRHFCKMCRRYWTKGGALRNVPVGGGFRKNSKRSSNKGGRGRVSEANPNSTSPISSNNHNINDHCNMLDNSTTTSLTGRSFQPPRMSQFPILTSLQGLNQHGCSMYNNLGFKFGAEAEPGFQVGSSVSSVNADHQWIRSTPNHFPNNFLAGFDPAQFSLRPSSSSSSSSLYNFPIGHQCLNQQAGSNQHLVRPSFASLKNLTDQKDNNVRSCGES